MSNHIVIGGGLWAISLFFLMLTAIFSTYGISVLFGFIFVASSAFGGVYLWDARKMREADHLIYHRNGSVSVDLEKMLRHPKVQRQLDGFQRLFMRETIVALWQGRQPPHSVGGYGTLTKKKLIVEWNDDWQAEMDKLSESHDISYNILFGIKEEPKFTAEEIAAQYVEEKDKKDGYKMVNQKK